MIDRTKLPNSFEFVVTAGARARQLLAGSTPRVAVGENKKTTVAQREVITRAVEKVAVDPAAPGGE
jgi:DNA-directed RNA polymerase omega subunit